MQTSFCFLASIWALLPPVHDKPRRVVAWAFLITTRVNNERNWNWIGSFLGLLFRFKIFLWLFFFFQSMCNFEWHHQKKTQGFHPKNRWKQKTIVPWPGTCSHDAPALLPVSFRSLGCLPKLYLVDRLRVNYISFAWRWGGGPRLSILISSSVIQLFELVVCFVGEWVSEWVADLRGWEFKSNNLKCDQMKSFGPSQSQTAAAPVKHLSIMLYLHSRHELLILQVGGMDWFSQLVY